MGISKSTLFLLSAIFFAGIPMMGWRHRSAKTGQPYEAEYEAYARQGCGLLQIRS